MNVFQKQPSGDVQKNNYLEKFRNSVVASAVNSGMLPEILRTEYLDHL